MIDATPHLVFKHVGDNTPIEYFYGADWEITAFWMDDLRGSPTKEEAIRAYKNRKAKRYEELMDDIWNEDT